MKLVRIKFRDKTSIVMEMEQAEEILSSNQQLVMLYDDKGVWTGQSINKSEIIGTDRDFYEERRETSNSEVEALPEPVLSQEERKKLLDKYRPVFLKRKNDKN